MAGGGRKAPPLLPDLENVKKIKAVKNSLFFILCTTNCFFGGKCIKLLGSSFNTHYSSLLNTLRFWNMDPSTVYVLEISSVTFPSLLTRSWSMRDRPGTLKPPGSSATNGNVIM